MTTIKINAEAAIKPSTVLTVTTWHLDESGAFNARNALNLIESGKAP